MDAIYVDWIGKKTDSRGVGDTVSKMIKIVSRDLIKECDGCIKRKESLNRAFPYKEVRISGSVDRRKLTTEF